MSAGSVKAVLYALGANTGIALGKSVGAVITGSGSLFAEALHSWADCGNQILLLIGMKNAKKTPDADHPMGYGKVAYFYSMCVGMLLFFGAGVTAIKEGFERMHSTEPVSYIGVSIGILILAVLLESFSLWGALKGAEAERGDQSIWEWFKSTRQAELLVVTAEDIAALAGLLIALLALIATAVTGNPIFDAIGSVFVGILLVVVAVLVMLEIKSLITGESASSETREAILMLLGAHPEVEKVFNLITIQWGSDVMVAVKAKMKPQVSDLALIDAINAVEQELQDKLGIRWVFFEPDVR